MKKLLVCVIVLCILLVMCVRQRQEQYHYLTSEQRAVKAIAMGIYLYDLYTKYKPCLNRFLGYIKDKNKFKKDLCKWSRDKSLFKALGYIFKKMIPKVPPTGQKRRVLKILSDLCFKINILAVTIAQIAPIAAMLGLSAEYMTHINRFVNINEVTSREIQKFLGMDETCGEEIPVPTIDPNLLPKSKDNAQTELTQKEGQKTQEEKKEDIKQLNDLPKVPYKEDNYKKDEDEDDYVAIDE